MKRKLENDTKDLFLNSLIGRKDICVYRNNVGMAFNKAGSPIRYGLKVGSGDFIGWKTIKITEGMVGKEIAVFLSVELKRDKKASPNQDQINWRTNVANSGGISLIVAEKEDLDGL